MKKELHYYDIFPKVFIINEEAHITIKPLGSHAAFAEKVTVKTTDDGIKIRLFNSSESNSSAVLTIRDKDFKIDFGAFEVKTFNYAIGQVISAGISRAGAGSASAVVMMLVPIIVFVVSQSNVIETMSTSGMKD